MLLQLIIINPKCLLVPGWVNSSISVETETDCLPVSTKVKTYKLTGWVGVRTSEWTSELIFQIIEQRKINTRFSTKLLQRRVIMKNIPVLQSHTLHFACPWAKLCGEKCIQQYYLLCQTVIYNIQMLLSCHPCKHNIWLHGYQKEKSAFPVRFTSFVGLCNP